MDAIRAIPKKLLIHRVTHAVEAPTDRWGDKQGFESRQNLQFVRMEPTSKVIRSENSAEIQLAATLFYDCKNSRPQGIAFAVEDLIIFNGQKHRVKLVEPLYDGNKLHHYEIGVIAHA